MKIFNKDTFSSIQDSCVSMRGNKVTINGKTFDLPKGSISIINGKIFVNGKEYKPDDKELSNVCITDVTVTGNVNKIDCGGSVTVNGDVYGNIDSGGSVTIKGEHTGSIDAGGSVHIK